MSSETSTDVSTSSFRTWHVFVLAGLVAATVAVVTVRPSDPPAVVLLVAAVGAAVYVAFACYRMVVPLAAREFGDRTELVGGRARAALEREKTLVLRSLKELEFDQAMGKVSADDFHDMSERLRTRARTLLKQLDVDRTSFRDAIERELAERLERAGSAPPGPATRPGCPTCGAPSDADAKFCKECGARL